MRQLVGKRRASARQATIALSLRQERLRGYLGLDADTDRVPGGLIDPAAAPGRLVTTQGHRAHALRGAADTVFKIVTVIFIGYIAHVYTAGG